MNRFVYLMLKYCFLIIRAEINIKPVLIKQPKQCVNQVILTNFHTKLILIIKQSLNRDDNLLGNISSTHRNVFIVIDENYNVPNEYKKERVDNIIVLLQCFDSRKLLNALKKLMIISIRAKVLMLVDEDCEIPVRNLTEEVLTILEPSHVLVLYMQNCQFFWTRPFDQRRQIHECSSNLTIEEKWPRDFLQYPLRVAVDPQPPYVIAADKENDYRDGVEIRITRLVARHFNFGIEFMGSPEGEIARMLYGPDGRTVGLLGLLDRLEADVAFAGIQSDPTRGSVVELLTTHTVDSTKWVIPSAPHSDNWEALYEPFPLLIWTLIALSLLSASLTILLFRQHDSALTFIDIILEIGSGLLDQGFHLSFQHPVFKLFSMTFIMFSLIITNAYRSCLVSNLTSKPKVSWFNTPDDAVAAGYLTVLVPSGKPNYDAAADEPLFKEILKPGRHRYSFDLPGTLSEISFKRKSMHLCINIPCKLAIINDFLNMLDEPLATILPNRFQPFMVTMFAAPGFPLMPFFNKVILQIIAGGFNYYWMDELLYKAHVKTSFRNYVLRVQNNVDSGPVKLTVDHLKSLFYVLLLGLGLSFLIFIMELLFKRSRSYNIRRVRF